jgi:hypothetical protein
MGKVFFEVWNTVYLLINFIFMISDYLKMRFFIKFAKVLVLKLSFKKTSLLLSARKIGIPDFPDKKA